MMNPQIQNLFYEIYQIRYLMPLGPNTCTRTHATLHRNWRYMSMQLCIEVFFTSGTSYCITDCWITMP